MKLSQLLTKVCLLVCLGAPFYSLGQGLQIDRIEPPHWWVGMHSRQLELMLHAEQIAQWSASLKHPHVKLLGTLKSNNPNYLWLQIEVSPKALPGPVTLVLRKGQELQKVTYVLEARATGSAARQGFSPADVVLNLMPDRFANGNSANDSLPGFEDKLNRAQSGARHGGDIQGISQHLDHIADMGYTAIWPTPLLENKQASFSYHGYASTDNYLIDARFGSNDSYRDMVQRAKEKGLKVIQDVVPNHVGDQHWWMRDLPAKDWLSNANTYTPTNHARTTVSDPYASAADREVFTGGWFSQTMPDLNSKNPRVANYLIQNAIWWAEYAGLAGFRVDTYGYSDAAFINEWVRRIRQEYPRFGIVGEEWTDNPAVQSYWARGKIQANGFRSELPSVMDFVLHGQMLKAFAEPESWNTGLKRLYESLANDQLVKAPQDQMLFDGNHDTPRLFSALNHDPDLTRMALTYVLTMKRTPQIYYGTEVLMTSPQTHNDFDAFRDDFPGGWAGDQLNAFTGKGLSDPQKEHQQWLRKLLNWRKKQGVIHHGNLMHFVPENGTYVMVRFIPRKPSRSAHKTSVSEAVMVMYNKNHVVTPLQLDRFKEIWPANARVKNVITDATLQLGAVFQLPPRSVTILQLENP
jgi:glycosidase